ncbi:hypothetical protein RI129_007997 [Pyrocoelia pectoralis]|uniref:Uncharacterized protein n=1 Tax=Pyrocoelia pectoralis TaxID=417401 RepID=A0AAN7ZIZ0_9COLE
MTFKSFTKNFKNYLTHYCSNASIHGLKFLAEKDRSIIERIWWFVFIALSIFLCVNSVVTTHRKWLHSPVIVTFATSETPIYQIPFPAITICPLNKIDRKKFSFNTSEDSEGTMTYASLLCDEATQYVSDLAEDVDNGALDFLLNISSGFDTNVWKCEINEEYCGYEDYPNFIPTLSIDGVCFSFNFLDRNDLFTTNTDLDHYERLGIPHQSNSSWTTAEGYKLDAKLGTYPRRAVAAGISGGLDLILHSSKEQSKDVCANQLDGYKVILGRTTSSGRIPTIRRTYFLVPQNQLVSVGIKPNMLRTSPEIQKYKPKDRKCFLDDEKKLKFFKGYDQQNCLSECLANYSYAKCDCVGFYMPRSKGTPICGPGSKECLRTAQHEFLIADSELKLERYNRQRADNPLMFDVPKKYSKKLRTVPKPKCNCLPSCNSLSYDIETSQIEWHWYKLYPNANATTSGLSRLRIFFKDWQFMSSERNELYGESEFWANCGGLLGLFFGCSLLSIIEILYYATLRLCCNIKNFGLSYWSGPGEKESKRPHSKKEIAQQ